MTNSEQHVIKLDFNTPYREIDVNGERFKVNMDDEVRDKILYDFRDAFESIEKMQKNKKDVAKMTREDNKKHREKLIEHIREALDANFEDGAFEKLYAAAGRSIPNCVQFLAVVMEAIKDFDESIVKRYQKNKADAFLKNKKQ